MTVFIHVGLQKTGTTALQELVFKKLDVNYLRYLDRDLYQNIGGLYQKSFSVDKPTLISNEDLSGYFPSWNRYEILENLRVLFPDARIIVGIRKSEIWAKSMYKEAVRQGFTGDYRGFKRLSPDWVFDLWRYADVLNRKFHGVYLYEYEELLKDFDGVVNGLCHFMGVPVPEYEQRVLNQSIRDWQIPGFRVMNTVAPSLFKYYYKLIRRDLQQ